MGKGSRDNYERYKQEKRREKNKIRDLKKYIKSNPNDLLAMQRIQELQKVIGLV